MEGEGAILMAQNVVGAEEESKESARQRRIPPSSHEDMDEANDGSSLCQQKSFICQSCSEKGQPTEFNSKAAYAKHLKSLEHKKVSSMHRPKIYRVNEAAKTLD